MQPVTVICRRDRDDRAEAAVGDQDWKRIEVELGTLLPGNCQHGRRPPASQRSIESEISENDAVAILKHIEEALHKNAEG
jgi:hypothetical protein